MIHKKLYNFLKEVTLSFLFEKDALVQKLEMMNSDELWRHATKATGIHALFSYQDPLIKTLIWNMKFRKNKKCFELAGALLYEALVRLTIEKPLIIPVPLSGKRKRKRGYNQIEELLYEIKRRDTEKKFEIKINLVKKKHRPPQTSLSKLERGKNLLDSFFIQHPEVIAGRNIVVIDDVITTGATMEEMRRVLLKAGAKTVGILAIAHA